jgi:D-aminopeptidase
MASRAGEPGAAHSPSRDRDSELEAAAASAPARAVPDGSCIAVCATDAPMSAHQLRRLALRPLLGIASAGSYAAEGSGEIGLAFTTSSEPGLDDDRLSLYFAAAYDTSREAVYNCLVAARPAERLDGSMQEAFPLDEVRR